MNTTLNEGEFMVCALYPYQAQDMKQLSLKPHERIKVIQMHKSGWWIGENAAGEVALFPANYVRREVCHHYLRIHLSLFVLTRSFVSLSLYYRLVPIVKII